MTETAGRPGKQRAKRRAFGRPLCRLDELNDPGSARFIIWRADEQMSLVVIRRGNAVFGYLNNCPHIGAPLDYRTDSVLDESKEHIRCGYHGALFRIDDGLCLSGPPERLCLTPVMLEVKDGKILSHTWRRSTPG